MHPRPPRSLAALTAVRARLVSAMASATDVLGQLAADSQEADGSSDASARGRRNHRVAVMLTRDDARILRELAAAWNCPVATAAYGLLADRLRLASRRAGQLGGPEYLGVASAVLAGIVPRSALPVEIASKWPDRGVGSAS